MNYDDRPTVNARHALIRHAVMTEQIEKGLWRFKIIKRPRSGYKPPYVSAEAKEQYQFELLERAGSYMDAGVPEAQADAYALDDLGCVEYWDYIRRGGALCGPLPDENVSAKDVERAA